MLLTNVNDSLISKGACKRKHQKLFFFSILLQIQTIFYTFLKEKQYLVNERFAMASMFTRCIVGYLPGSYPGFGNRGSKLRINEIMGVKSQLYQRDTSP